MERKTGGEAVVDCFRRENVRRVFGVPGESFLPVLDELYEDPDIEWVSARHEQGAISMASGWAKAGRGTGVVMASRSVGAANLTIGLHTARHDSTPLVVLIGQVPTHLRGREALQETELADLYRPVVKWSLEVEQTGQIPRVVREGFRRAKSGRPGPVLISLPEDRLEARAGMRVRASGPIPGGAPTDDSADEALDRLIGAENPVLIAGDGVLRAGATEKLVDFVERLSLPVVSAFRRHDVFPNNHPLYLGCSAFGIPEPLEQRLLGADLVFALGSRLSEVTSQQYRLPSEKTPLIQADISPEVIGNNTPAAVGLVGDAGATLGVLLSRLEERGLSDAFPDRRRDVEELRARIERSTSKPDRWDSPGNGVHPGAVIEALNDLLPPEAALVTDAGNFYGWLNRYYRWEQAGTFYGPTDGAMGYSLPAAIGVKMARPDRPVVSLAGDGGFMMVLQELETAVRCDASVHCLVFNNGRYGTIRLHQEYTYPEREIGTELGNPDFAALAESFGVRGITIESNEAVVPELKRALDHDGSVVVDIRQDPRLLAVDYTLPFRGGSN